MNLLAQLPVVIFLLTMMVFLKKGVNILFIFEIKMNIKNYNWSEESYTKALFQAGLKISNGISQNIEKLNY